MQDEADYGLFSPCNVQNTIAAKKRECQRVDGHLSARWCCAGNNIVAHQELLQEAGGAGPSGYKP